MSRIDDLKRQNPTLNVNLIDLIAEADPSDSYKYLGFLIKMLKDNSSNNNMNILRHIFGEENILALSKFEEHSRANRIKVKDIGLYTSFKQIKDEVKEAEEIVRIKEMEKQTKVIHKDDDWLVLIPLSYEASKLYGRNTKWCTTQEKYWTQYIPNYKLIYIINRKNDNVKYAISSKVDYDLVEGWKANDESVNPFMIPLPAQILGLIAIEIRDKRSITKMDEYKKINSRTTQYERSKLTTIEPNTYRPVTYSGTTDVSAWLEINDDDADDYLNSLRTYQDRTDMIERVMSREENNTDFIDANHILQIFNKLKLR